MKRVILPMLITFLLLSACAPRAAESIESVADYAGAPADFGIQDEELTYTSANIQNGSTIADSTETSQVERIVIKNASLGIIGDDPAQILEAIVQITEESGGYIVNSNLYRTYTDQGLEVPGAEISVRVPAEVLVVTIDRIKALLSDPEMDIQYENISGEDVTSDYTDLQSRLKNLEEARTKLEEIMDAASKTEDVLSVYNELTRVSEQIEVLKGRIQYYNEASRLSSLAVKITARESISELTIGGWRPAGVARNAIQALIDTLQFLANAAIWIGLYILPVVLCISIPAFLVFLGVRAIIRRRRNRIDGKEILEFSEEMPQDSPGN